MNVAILQDKCRTRCSVHHSATHFHLSAPTLCHPTITSLLCSSSSFIHLDRVCMCVCACKRTSNSYSSSTIFGTIVPADQEEENAFLMMRFSIICKSV